MVARPLSVNPGSLFGSIPGSARSTLFRLVADARPREYVQAHLLNDNLHGAGVTENLAPMPGGDNTRMSSGYEEPVKDAVLSENKVVEYVVEFFYGSHTSPALSDLEQELPTAFEVEATEMRLRQGVPATPENAQDPTNWEVHGAAFVASGPVAVQMPTTSLGASFVLRRLWLGDDFASATTQSGTAVPLADAQQIAQRALEQVPGVGPELARRILDARPTTEEALLAVPGIGVERTTAIQTFSGATTFSLTGPSDWRP
jgi:hypothetical protein